VNDHLGNPGYKKSALLDDRLVVHTWVGELTAATFVRFCEVHRPADGQLLAKARTVWCVIDPITGRPRRIDPTLRPYFYSTPPGAAG
jgi:acyl-CoA thioester hydrolase